MKRLTSLITGGLLLTTLAVAEPPKLVSTSPQLWAVGVDATKQKTVALTFDQPMRSGFWDWFGRDGLSPNSDLYTSMSPDLKTASLEVKLQPGKVYALGLNERGIPGVGFQNEKGLSLPPTYLVFQTAGTPAPDDAPPHAVRSVPANGTPRVDSTRTTAIAITFDQLMGTKKHGLHLFENGKPIDLSKRPFSYTSDGRTFMFPYTLKPASQYRLELNNMSDIGFSRANRIPLWPIQFSFTTQ